MDRSIGNFLSLIFLPLHAPKDRRDKVVITSLLSCFILSFYWTVFALQCCVNFYCTAKWTNYTSTFFRLPSHLGPHGALNRTPCAMPVLCSLVTYFIHSISSVNMSVPISQLIPPIPQLSLLISTCFFFPFLCLYFCFANQTICTIFLP